ncbi:ComEA family DNA-binding protein [Christiangramia sediminis]|uniref:Helix-hairpin-helix domain-containing protein n=1 Tax=Christiangramia sediminis TaxID=2881336 RepID=A0A9X1LIG5_9FLAO|nr:helix-hairpin-helix domain-containing protein [Christiangramia sediminis]MCB7480945.1 helix-hairpin-helix domain-containing protein [Christiangramia sediminis]
MKFLRSHFALSKGQQNGIFVLVLLIIGFQIFLFLNFPSEAQPMIDQSRIDKFQKKLDSLNQNSIKRKDTIYPFNPNYISDFKGYQLGMSIEEIDRLLAYRASGKWMNSAEDFQKITGISDSLLLKISPSFRFPEWTQKLNSVKIQSTTSAPAEINILDLNSVNAEDLKVVNGIGEVLSQRIIKYRNSIGGFLSLIQLKDVYGLTPEVVERIDQKFDLLSRPDVTIKNLNLINEEELAEIPYFNSKIAKEIITYRKLHEGISSFEELAKINAFPYDKIDRIKLYLAIE